VRITGGKFGGRVLAAPEDDRVRPTSDKVRQAIFNVLRHHDFGSGFSLEGATAVDLFAGTGALGLEAISRGAAFELFVEEDVESRALIRRNVETLDLTGATKIWRRDATSLGPMPAGSGGPFNLAFVDPPYRRDLAPRALESLQQGSWLAADAIVVVESGKSEELLRPEGYTLLDDRAYGDTRVVFLQAQRQTGGD
jgi:16S rRNA (guanine966-N2)-methyltransferase